MTTVPVEVDDELLKLADAQAAEAGRPRSEVLAAALRRGLGGGQLSRLLAEARKGTELFRGRGDGTRKVRARSRAS